MLQHRGRDILSRDFKIVFIFMKSYYRYLYFFYEKTPGQGVGEIAKIY